MKSPPECIPCSVNQALRTAKMAGVDEEAQIKAVNEAMRVLTGVDRNMSPAVISKIQNALLQADHNPGTIDGILGAQTHAALRAY